MVKDRSRRRAGPPGAAMTGALALLLVICLAECATEQRISRGSKPNSIQKVNGWRSQRGGSCLSYGHSCWGAHGKRSGNPPPDWFLKKLLQVNNANSDMRRTQETSRNDDTGAIYQRDAPIDTPSSDRLRPNVDDFSLDISDNRNMEAKPMLDDDLLSKIKLWQIMREASLE